MGDLDSIYTNPRDPGSYGGQNKLLKSARKHYGGTSAKSVQAYLQTKDAYTLHKPRRLRFKRNRFIMTDIDDLWQSDIADLSKLADENDGVRYLLVK